MSSVPHTLDPSIERDALRRVFDLATAAVGSARSGLEAVSFWTAIVLPVTYLPLLAGGFAGGEALAFAALLGANALAFLAGHGHEPSAAE